MRVVRLGRALVPIILVGDERAGGGAFHAGTATVGHPTDDTRRRSNVTARSREVVATCFDDACFGRARSWRPRRTDEPIPTPSAVAARAGRFTARLEQRDDYGIVLLLILATIVTISLGQGAGGQFIGVCLSGFTLLFVLHTSDAPRRGYRAASVIVGLAVAGAALSLLIGYGHGAAAAGLVGLLLAFAAPLVILRRITRSPTITVRLVLGALATYLLLGLTFSYLYPLIQFITGEPFFVQTSTPESVDYVYFSYVTLTTVGYGDFTAFTSVGRMIAVSEALAGQLYLVSAVALLVGNIGRSMVRGTPVSPAEIEPADESDSAGSGSA
jgi:Ion channel.